MMASGVQRIKHALSCAQHPALVTISLTEGRYDITEPWDQYRISLIMDFCLALTQVLDIYS